MPTDSQARQAAALSPFQSAERLRAALEARPEAQRTLRDYGRVLEAYRAVYHDDPASPKADAAISAVAGLLAEQGRVFSDAKSLHDAIGQYEFLRREYPASRYRFNALFAEGDIYLGDLHDQDAAKAVFQQFLKSYPRNPSANEARVELKEIRTGEIAERKRTKNVEPAASQSAQQSPPVIAPLKIKKSTVLTAAIQSQSMPASTAAEPRSRLPTSPPTESVPAPVEPTPVKRPEIIAPVEAAVKAPSPAHRGRLPLVTGVRHWSTPVYTRVAIDLQDEVQYEAARVPNPDRIFFDLHGARLSPELVGRSFQVTDDGFLKRIRVAQFSNDVTRIVLDVSDVSDYSAFLLPNPYRLIIDIHGRKPGTVPVETSANPARKGATGEPAVAAPGKMGAPPAGRPGLAVETKPAPPRSSPETDDDTVVITRRTPLASGSSTQDIAALGHQPDRVKATSHPTTAPIAASVAGTTPAAQPRQASEAGASRRRAKLLPGESSGETATAAGREADPTAAGSRSMVRALGLKIGRIVVDAGHGGHDSGTLGPDGIEEKDVVLDVALRLGKLLKQRLGADVIFTRDDDTFIPLETRTAIANKAQADLFISVHANSSQDSSARGVETYYLNFTSSPESLEVAARENAVSQQSVHQLSDLVKKIALHEKIDESREFAADVERNLYDGLEQGNPGLKDRGVKQAPFVVLIGANMPSILAEISFLTNPDDAHELRDPRYRQRIAESLYRGVARYVSGLSGIRLAEASGHTAGN